MKNPDGGSAYPDHIDLRNIDIEDYHGMTLRDWFAGTIKYDKELMENVSRCDDQDLIERFGLESEKDEYFEYVGPESDMPFKNIELRIKLEARARARLRYLEADAMIAERDK
jgi:hypothetical protein